MNRMLFMLLTIVVMFTQIGCWDVKDVADSAFITAIGLDASDKPGMLRVTFVIPKPSVIRMRSDKLFNVEQTVEAENISKAIEKLETRLPRYVRLGHLRLVIIGEKLAAEDFRSYTNLFEKTPEVALRTRIMFVQGGEAEEIFHISPILNRGSISELVGLAMTGQKNAMEKTVSFQGLRKALFTGKGAVLTSRVVVNKSKAPSFLEHKGGAVLKDWRLLGWLNENENRDANWILHGTAPVVTGKMGEGMYTFSVEKKSTHITPKVKGDHISFTVKVNVSGNIVEEQFGTDLSDPKTIERLQTLFAGIIKKQVINAVKQSQKAFQADYLGFGRALEIKNPQLYRKMKWDKAYPNAGVNVMVETKIHRFGKTK